MKKKILMVYTNYSAFVKTDYEILSKHYEITKYQYRPTKGIISNSFEFAKQFLFLIFNIWKFQIIYVWFGDYHSFLPVLFSKIFNKKSFVVIGGYDVANLPEFNYGSLTKPLRKHMTLFSFRHATLCIPVVEELEKKLHEICPKAKSKTIYTGYDFKTQHPIDFDFPREKLILTVSITENYQRYKIKGLDRFKELAENLPEYKFVVVGVKENAKSLFAPIPSNLHLYPPVQQKELTDFYLKASYYAQLSRSEGLPNALCEAMLYGCIPIGMNVGGIASTIEEKGLIINEWDIEQIMDFMVSANISRRSVSNHILFKFDLEQRFSSISQTIN